MIRKLLLAVGIMIASSTAAHAQFFVPGTAQTCVTFDFIAGIAPCGSLPEQILQYVRQALQLAQEEITAAHEVTNTLSLGGGLFQDATGALKTIVTNVGDGDLWGDFTHPFIDKLAAPDYPLPDDTGQQELVREQNAVSAAISALGSAIDNETPRIANAAAIFNQLQAEALGNAGRHMTLQDSAQLGAAHAQWSQSHEVITMATAQAQHATLLAQHDRAAMSNKWVDLMATAYLPIDTGAAPGY